MCPTLDRTVSIDCFVTQHPSEGMRLIAVVCMCAGWWYKPDFIINDININSAITSPAHDEVVKLDSRNAYFNLCGYAYSGAACDHLAFLMEQYKGIGLHATSPKQASDFPALAKRRASAVKWSGRSMVEQGMVHHGAAVPRLVVLDLFMCMSEKTMVKGDCLGRRWAQNHPV